MLMQPGRHYTILLISHDVNHDIRIIKEIFTMCWNEFIINVNLVARYKNTTTIIYTFQPFNENNCNDTTPTIHSEYQNFIMNKTINNLFSNKIKNMYKCPVIVATFRHEPFIIINKIPTMLPKLSGIEGKMLKFLSDRFNFSIEIHFESGRWGIIANNHSTIIEASGCIKKVMDREANITIGSFGMSKILAQYLELTKPHIQSQLLFIVPPGRPFTPFEKLFKPFKFSLWIVLLVIFMFGYISINLLKYFDRKIINKVIGYHNSLSFFNMISIFLGCPLMELPRRNFTRTILMLWILLSLNVRSIYQGRLFDLIQVDGNRSTLNTITQVIRSKYIIAASIGFWEFFEDDLKLFEPLYPYNSTIRHNYLLENVRNYDANFVIAALKIDTAYVNSINTSHGILSTTKDTLREVPICTYLPKGSFFAQPFSMEISHILSSGFIEHWKNKYLKKSFEYQKRYEKKNPKQLTYLHISGCFKLCLALFLLSTIVFALEVITKYSIKLKRVMDYITY